MKKIFALLAITSLYSLHQPLLFEKNKGQTSGCVEYIGKGDGHTLFFTPDKIVISFVGADLETGANPSTPLAFEFNNANKNPKIVGLEERASKSHYFQGNDPNYWISDVPHFAKVKYEKIYEGIDIVFYENGKTFEYDLVVEPGTHPKEIELHIEGAEQLILEPNGDLSLYTKTEVLTMQKPVVYQMIAGEKVFQEGVFYLSSPKDIKFLIPRFDPKEPLIIDPALTLTYSSYLGGGAPGGQSGAGIEVDQNGFVYVAGATSSGAFPTTGSAFQSGFAGGVDAFVSKFDTSQNGGPSLIYSTYLGGALADSARAIAVDADGNAYLTGTTSSTNFPITPLTAYQTMNSGGSIGFVTKLNPSGSALIYSTYFGSNATTPNGIQVSLDKETVYLVGLTSSSMFPVINGYQLTRQSSGANTDIFISRLNTSIAGTAGLIYSTYLGGSVSV